MSFDRRQALLFGISMATVSAVAELAKADVPDPGKGEGLLLSDIFPDQFADWTIDPQSLPVVRTASGGERILEAYDQLLERTFVDSNGYRVMLSVASSYGSAASMQLHMPQVCYSANGYRVSELAPGTLNLSDRDLSVRRMRAEMPGRIEPLTYWAVVAERVATEYFLTGSERWEFRRRRLMYALRREPVSGMLVRVSSIDPQTQRAHTIQARFSNAMLRAIDPGYRAKVIGVEV